MIVRYKGADPKPWIHKAMVNWGGNDDPELHLKAGIAYGVDRVEVHTQHTKIWIDGHKYNSIHFDVVERDESTPEWMKGGA